MLLPIFADHSDANDQEDCVEAPVDGYYYQSWFNKNCILKIETNNVKVKPR